MSPSSSQQRRSLLTLARRRSYLCRVDIIIKSSPPLLLLLLCVGKNLFIFDLGLRSVCLWFGRTHPKHPITGKSFHSKTVFFTVFIWPLPLIGPRGNTTPLTHQDQKQREGGSLFRRREHFRVKETLPLLRALLFPWKLFLFAPLLHPPSFTHSDNNTLDTLR